MMFFVPLLKCLLFVGQWYSLSDVKSGRVHFVLEWVPTSSEPDRLDQVNVVLFKLRIDGDTDVISLFLLRSFFVA